LGDAHIALVGAAAHATIENHFVRPELSPRLSSGQKFDQEVEPGKAFDDAFRAPNSLAILGSPQSGKTSLAHYLAISCASGAADCDRLPFVARFGEVRPGAQPLWRLLRTYASESYEGHVTRAFVEKEKILAIVDDVDLLDQPRIDILKRLIETFPNVRWVLVFKQPVLALSLEPDIRANFPDTKIFAIGELSRQSIRALSANWMGSTDDPDKTDELYRSVMEQVRRTGLPRSGYIISLMLWALRNRSRGELLNEASLLQNVLDHMLGRMDYTGALRSSFDFTAKTAVLQEWAYYLKDKEEFQSKNEAIQFVITYLEQKGLRFDAAEIVNGFISCGVFEQVGEMVAFRHRRFQEFFIAGYLRDNPAGYQRAISTNDWLNYSRQLDIFASRYRQETGLLELGLARLSEIKVPEPRLQGEELSEYLASGPQLGFSQQQLKRMRKEPLTAEQIDQIMDKTERRVVQKRGRKQP
jgi:hypothetical protein